MSQPYAKVSRRVLGVTLAAAVGGFLFGFDTAVINGAVDALRGDTAGFGLDAALTGIAVSSALLGCMLGAVFAGRVADSIGRVKVMLIAAVLFGASSILSGLAFGVGDFILWRIVAGLGIGTASVVVPTYIAEMAPAAVRGRLASLQQFAIGVGIFAAFLSDAALAGVAGSPEQSLWFGAAAWRWMLIVGVVPSVVYIVLALRLPESPRYLVAKGRDDDARRILADVVGETDPTAKVAEIHHTLRTDHRPRFSDLIKKGGGLKPVVWIAIAVAVFQQTTGINNILYYGSSLWASVGFSGGLALVIPIGTSLIGLAMALIALSVVDRVGRRPMLMYGAAGMAVFLALVAVAFSTGTPGVEGEGGLALGWAIVGLVAAHLFYIVFCATWGPVMWVFLAEIFPNQLRAMGMALAVGVHWIANFAVAFTFPILSDGIGLSLTYVIYAVITGIAFVFVMLRVPETRGRTLEEMTEDVRVR